MFWIFLLNQSTCLSKKTKPKKEEERVKNMGLVTSLVLVFTLIFLSSVNSNQVFDYADALTPREREDLELLLSSRNATAISLFIVLGNDRNTEITEIPFPECQALAGNRKIVLFFLLPFHRRMYVQGDPAFKHFLSKSAIHEMFSMIKPQLEMEQYFHAVRKGIEVIGEKMERKEAEENLLREERYAVSVFLIFIGCVALPVLYFLSMAAHSKEEEKEKELAKESV